MGPFTFWQKKSTERYSREYLVEKLKELENTLFENELDFLVFLENCNSFLNKLKKYTEPDSNVLWIFKKEIAVRMHILTLKYKHRKNIDSYKLWRRIVDEYFGSEGTLAF